MQIFYTDGACSGNPGPGGFAAIHYIDDNNIHYFTGNEQNTTNNKMELRALFVALNYAYSNYKTDEIIIYTDSAYIANCINQKWYIKWKQNGWHTSTKELVKNKELWIEILNLLKHLNVTIQKVEGHSNNKLNNLADKYAVEARKGEVTWKWN